MLFGFLHTRERTSDRRGFEIREGVGGRNASGDTKCIDQFEDEEAWECTTEIGYAK